MTMDDGDDAKQRTPAEVFRIFLRLGVTSFGGPVAHIGYFRQAFVERRRWLDEASFADLVALCQFLPGPASSQVVFSLGLMRGGWLGGLAASAGFTLPSALVMLVFAYVAADLNGPLGVALLHGLKLVAVAIVAQAVWGMASSLCPDRTRAGIAVVGLALVTAVGSAAGQISAIILGGCAGALLCQAAPAAVATGALPSMPVSRRLGLSFIAVFAVLLVVPPLLLTGGMRSQSLALFEAFYRSGALVFGGGHVVLPLLRDAVVAPGWVSPDAFLAGYGAAQSVPGPLFTFAAYLGAVMGPWPNGVVGAVVALVAIFLPGLLLVAGALPFWDAFRRRPSAQAAMRGTNAAVVGILAAALYNPVWTSAVTGSRDFAIAAVGFVLLVVWRCPPLAVVVAIVMATIMVYELA
ncbi:MAG TPA: chromate efflux transporter [Acetobacteraceae bacterium]|nr:chromate efflux transporter [Acetobacteraceae bacterium]